MEPKTFHKLGYVGNEDAGKKINRGISFTGVSTTYWGCGGRKA